MSYEFTLTATIPATPEEIYNAWLDSDRHTAMTGAPARIAAEPGGAYTAWDGYISGRNLELVPHRRIVQSWRTTRFAEDQADLTITVTLTPVEAGTLLTLLHADVPDGQTSYESGGWQAHYFEPMKTYFANR